MMVSERKVPAGEVLVPCSCCHGTGKVTLTGVYLETLELLRASPGEATGAMLAPLAGCEATAMNNRLARLEELALVTSRRYGRLRLYLAVIPRP